jgi:hypothetical protein
VRPTPPGVVDNNKRLGYAIAVQINELNRWFQFLYRQTASLLKTKQILCDFCPQGGFTLALCRNLARNDQTGVHCNCGYGSRGGSIQQKLNHFGLEHLQQFEPVFLGLGTNYFFLQSRVFVVRRLNVRRAKPEDT